MERRQEVSEQLNDIEPDRWRKFRLVHRSGTERLRSYPDDELQALLRDIKRRQQEAARLDEDNEPDAA